MCGIAGYVLKDVTVTGAGQLSVFLRALRQRGPDGEGVCLAHLAAGACLPLALPFKDPLPIHDAALVHTRYAVIDPSPAGHQPFTSRNGKVTAVLNGEIYNYLELKEELKGLGVVFRSASDTEVLVEGYRVWKDGLWPRMNGFWAVALYDADAREIVLSRDRLGVAPLYYRETPHGFFFCSLIMPLASMAPAAAVNTDVLHGFLETGFKDIHGATFFEGIRSFSAASVARIGMGPAGGDPLEARHFWQCPQAPWGSGDISFDEARRSLKETLIDAVRLRLRSDIPLAFELSGGMDSSAVVAAAAQVSAGKLTTFTLKVKGRDEEPFARAMRGRYALDYQVIDAAEAGLNAEAGDFSNMMEEPYDTPANYTHHRMLREIKARGFDVVLTGAGGDEALAGYEASFWPEVCRSWSRGDLSHRYAALAYETCRRFSSWAALRRTLAGHLSRFSGAACSSTGIRFSAAGQLAAEYQRMGFFDRRRFHLGTALLPYYLRSTDHYTMNIPVEHRFPLLDYRLVELGMKFPAEYLFHHGWTKYILRKAMEPLLPPSIVWRRQKFGFPFAYGAFFHKGAAGQPLLRHLAALDRWGVRPGDQEVVPLMERDPLKLWRYISVGVWTGGLKEGM